MPNQRKLILISHGKTEAEWDGDDFARPLRSSGKRLAQKFGSYLAEHGMNFPMVASPARRTRISAEKAAKVCGRPVSRIQFDKWLYRPGLPEQLSILTPLLLRNDLIYFGHPAALRDLLLHLIGEDAAQTFGIGQLAQLTVELDRSSGRITDAELDLLLSDRQLPRGFPYSGTAGEARRPRPAYYYTQSGVIPYRMTSSGPRILLISTKDGKRWGVPKGICEPGLSPQVSAAKEALEEAGVAGPVSDHACGQYQVAKWGGVCTVRLHPMRVEEELANGRWAENTRSRAWHLPEDAAQRVHNQALSGLIARFSQDLARRH